MINKEMHIHLLNHVLVSNSIQYWYQVLVIAPHKAKAGLDIIITENLCTPGQHEEKNRFRLCNEYERMQFTDLQSR